MCALYSLLCFLFYLSHMQRYAHCTGSSTQVLFIMLMRCSRWKLEYNMQGLSSFICWMCAYSVIFQCIFQTACWMQITFFLCLVSVFSRLLSASMCIMFMDQQRREADFLLLLLSWAKWNHAMCYSWMSFCDFL